MSPKEQVKRDGTTTCLLEEVPQRHGSFEAGLYDEILVTKESVKHANLFGLVTVYGALFRVQSGCSVPASTGNASTANESEND